MVEIQLRDLCGVRSGDKGDVSDLSLFADDQAAAPGSVDQLPCFLTRRILEG